jgi:hypothetical protein
MRAPLEVRLAAALLVGSAAVFLLAGLLRLVTEGGGGLLTAPLLQLALSVGVAGGLLNGIRLARWFGMALALLGALVHMLLALQPLPWWARVVSGLLAAAQVYAAVLLNTKPAVEATGGGGRRR